MHACVRLRSRMHVGVHVCVCVITRRLCVMLLEVKAHGGGTYAISINTRSLLACVRTHAYSCYVFVC